MMIYKKYYSSNNCKDKYFSHRFSIIDIIIAFFNSNNPEPFTPLQPVAQSLSNGTARRRNSMSCSSPSTISTSSPRTASRPPSHLLSGSSPAQWACRMTPTATTSAAGSSPGTPAGRSSLTGSKRRDSKIVFAAQCIFERFKQTSSLTIKLQLFLNLFNRRQTATEVFRQGLPQFVVGYTDWLLNITQGIFSLNTVFALAKQ